ncbi:cytochrome b/b6 domain-containing protein [Microbacterium keratanolyticum]
MVERMLRRGLPRVAGGDPWPPALAVEVGVSADAPAESAAPAPGVPETPVSAGLSAAETGPLAEQSPAAPETPPVVAVNPAKVGPLGAMRRGLPRVADGEPWPPAGAASPAGVATPSPAVPATPVSAGPGAADVGPTVEQSPAVPETPAAVAANPAQAGPAATMRRGLPRVEGGEGWPPAGLTARVAVAETATDAPSVPASEVAEVPAAAPAAVALTRDVSTPLPFRRTVWQGTAPRHAVEPEPEASRFRPTWPQVLGGLMGAAALGIIAGAGIALVRALLSMSFMQDFLAAFPGEYHLPEGTQPGFPAWIGWQHFFNVFLMVLIIRSGLRVRSEKRPTVFWAPRGNAKGKISLTLWFHQALDILWLVNGVIFVVLLFVSGHWVRIVPTSWEVFPNALSALLQYISFDWPTENGWVNYNSLQQLAYFTTVFIAAPLAAITGFRMSGMWPKKAEKLSKAYPVEWARTLHFPIMLYFVAFIFVHVMLVVLTGFLRNLNHMYAAQDAVTWTGFWVFVASMVVIVGAWIAARPIVLAPIAKVFGNVSGR